MVERDAQVKHDDGLNHVGVAYKRDRLIGMESSKLLQFEGHASLHFEHHLPVRRVGDTSHPVVSPPLFVALKSRYCAALPITEVNLVEALPLLKLQSQMTCERLCSFPRPIQGAAINGRNRFFAQPIHEFLCLISSVRV